MRPPAMSDVFLRGRGEPSPLRLPAPCPGRRQRAARAVLGGAGAKLESSPGVGRKTTAPQFVTQGVVVWPKGPGLELFVWVGVRCGQEFFAAKKMTP